MTTYRLWPSTSGPGAQATDAGNYTMGIEFSVSTPGCTLTQIHFWASGTVTSSDHACRLYQVDTPLTGTLVTGSSKAFTSPLSVGWNTVTLDAPIALTAGQAYRACVWFTVDNGYTATSDYWGAGAGSAGITNGPLTAPPAATANHGDQCSFNAGADAFPADSFNATNYWIDVTVDDGAAGQRPPRSVIVTGPGTLHPSWQSPAGAIITATPVAVSGPSVGAELGIAAIGLGGYATPKKTAAVAGRCTTGLAGSGAAAKKTAAGGRCALALGGSRSSAPIKAVIGRGVLALTAATRPAALPAGIYAGTPTYPAAWVAGPPA